MVGSRFCRFFTRSACASLTSRVAVSLKSPSFSSAVVIRGRSLIKTSSAGGILFNASLITSRCPANVSASRFSDLIDAIMLSRWSSSVPTNVSNRVSSSRTCCWRPDNAVLKLWMMSPSCASPPVLITSESDARVCSVDGYFDDLLSGIVEPGSSRPRGASPSGGFSATCIDPSRLVWPTVATALAGTTTSGCTETSTFACHPCTVILPTLPTTTSSIITGEFDSRVPTFATSTW